MSAKQKWHQMPECSDQDLDMLFKLCRGNKWDRVFDLLEQNPMLGVTPMMMDNHINTTVLHQAITSKGNTNMRAQVIFKILHDTPSAAAVKNGYGSLPLHVCCQRNVKMDASTKEKVVIALIQCFPDACVQEGGVGKRTPLHILFTDYVSVSLTRLMIEKGGSAAHMKDKNGYLPAHVACSRHCSPEKLRMLLEANPMSLYEKTYKGDTLLSLAESTATKSHPNYALIDELQRQLKDSDDSMQIDHGMVFTDDSSRSRLGSSDTNPSIESLWESSRPVRKRKFEEPNDANLLLHFAHTQLDVGMEHHSDTNEATSFTEV